MSAASIQDETVRDALGRLRAARPLSGSPLLGLDVVSTRISAAALEDSSATRGQELSSLLDELVGERLCELRGAPLRKSSELEPDSDLDAIRADFSADHIDREAWGALHFHFFDPGRTSLLELARQLGLSRRTIRRRIERGTHLLAARLRDMEMEAASEKAHLATPASPPADARSIDPLVGRRSELRRISELLAQHRLLRLTGQVGVGKSRLVRALVTEHNTGQAAQSWLIDLGPLASSEALAETLAEQLGLRLRSDENVERQLLDFLAPRKTLLVFDHVEPHSRALDELAERLLSFCPRLQVLLVGNEHLAGVKGTRFELGPLECPARGDSLEQTLRSPSARLLVQRIRAGRPDFVIRQDMVESLKRICRQLDGHPLAIEIAAARCGSRSLEHVAADIERSLDMQDAQSERPDHHRSLRAALDGSYTSLSSTARVLFAGLAVFEAPFGQEDVIDIIRYVDTDTDLLSGSSVSDGIEELMERSLVRSRIEGTKLELLGFVRSYAMERLAGDGQAEPWIAAHDEHFARLATEEAAAIDGESDAVRRMSTAKQDIIVTLERAVREDAMRRAQELALALAAYWKARGPFGEGRFWLDRVLSSPGGEPVLRIRLLGAAGELALLQGELDTARLRYEASLALAEALDDQESIAGLLRQLGSLADERGEQDTSERLYRDALQAYTVQEDAWGIAATLNNLGMLAFHAGRYDEAEVQLQESLDRFQELERTWETGIVHFNLGNNAFDRARYNEARRNYGRSLKIAESLGDDVGRGCAIRAMGNLEAMIGNYPGARQRLREAMELFLELEDRKRTAESVESLAEVERMEGRLVAAVRYLGVASALRSRIGSPIKRKDRDHFERLRSELAESLEPSIFEEAWAAGQNVDWGGLLRSVNQAKSWDPVPDEHAS